MKLVRPKSKQSLRVKLKRPTKRNNGKCMAAIIAEINPVLRGWYATSSTPRESPQRGGRLGEDAVALGATQTARKERSRPRQRPPQVAKPLLREARVVQPRTGQGRNHEPPAEEKLADWRAVCGRSARTVRRGGRRKPMRCPYLYQKRLRSISCVHVQCTALECERPAPARKGRDAPSPCLTWPALAHLSSRAWLAKSPSDSVAGCFGQTGVSAPRCCCWVQGAPLLYPRSLASASSAVRCSLSLSPRR